MARTETRPRLSRRQRLGLALARLSWRRLFIRLLAIVTSLVALAGIAASVYVYRQVDRAQGAAQAQLEEISGSFTQVAASLRTVSASANNAATSTNEAKLSLDGAAATTRAAADTLDYTAALINFSIPGLGRPLAGVDVAFRNQGTQLRTLAGQIDQTGGALVQNDRDLRAISADVGTIARDVEAVSRQLRTFADPGAGGLGQITIATRLLVAWSVVIHLLLLGMAVSLYLLTLDDRRRDLPALGWALDDDLAFDSER